MSPKKARRHSGKPKAKSTRKTEESNTKQESEGQTSALTVRNLWRSRIPKVASTVIGLLTVSSLYFFIPTVTASSMQPLSPLRARVSIANGGPVPINDVSVECRGNKVVFGETGTFVLHGYASIDEYSVNKVNSGEQFIAECPQPWALFMNENSGLLSYGDMRKDFPPVVIVPPPRKSSRPPESFQKRRYATSRNLLNDAPILAAPL
jgi:hypothetical protein